MAFSLRRHGIYVVSCWVKVAAVLLSLSWVLGLRLDSVITLLLWSLLSRVVLMMSVGSGEDEYAVDEFCSDRYLHRQAWPWIGELLSHCPSVGLGHVYITETVLFASRYWTDADTAADAGLMVAQRLLSDGHQMGRDWLIRAEVCPHTHTDEVDKAGFVAAATVVAADNPRMMLRTCVANVTKTRYTFMPADAVRRMIMLHRKPRYACQVIKHYRPIYNLSN